MLAAPIIHGRTLHIDFRDKLLAVPHDFKDSDIEWARDYILSSTKDIDYLSDRIKQIVFSNNKFCVIGITTKIKALCSVCGDAQSIALKDRSSRPIYAFIGFVFKLSDLSKMSGKKPFIIQNPDFLNKYNELVQPRWEEKLGKPEVYEPTRTEYEPLTLTPMELDGEYVKSLIFPKERLNSLFVNNDIIYIVPSNEENDRASYFWTLSEVFANNASCASLCTGVQNYDYVARGKFAFATCISTDKIGYFRREHIEKAKKNTCEETAQSHSHYDERMGKGYNDERVPRKNTNMNDFEKIEKYVSEFESIQAEGGNDITPLNIVSRVVENLHGEVRNIVEHMPIKVGKMINTKKAQPTDKVNILHEHPIPLKTAPIKPKEDKDKKESEKPEDSGDIFDM